MAKTVLAYLNVFVRQELWDKADKYSKESGNPYTDRWGVRQNVHNETVGLAKTVLAQWGAKHNFDFKVLEGVGCAQRT